MPIELMSADVFEEGREAVREYQDYLQKVVFDAVERVLKVRVLLGPGRFHELARRSGLSRSTVSGVLQGKRGASLETLRKLSEASGVELGKLTEYVEAQRKGRTTG